MKSKLLLMLAGVGLAAGGYFVAVATAAGPPTNPAETLYYAGFVTNSQGDPADGTFDVELEVYADAGGTTPLCSTGPLTGVVVTQGHFRVALPPVCVDSFNANPDTWMRLSFDNQNMGLTKVGAVPYALQAGHALTADNATNAENATNATNADNATTASSVAWDDVTSKPALSTYTNPETGIQITLDASPCGQSTPSTTGAFGTYGGAKTICENTCNSSTAHMCTANEVIRYMETGGTATTQNAWISGAGTGERVGSLISDCNGYVTDSNSVQGTYWNAGGHPSTTSCDTLLPLLCCD